MTPDDLYDEMQREVRHEAELDPRWTCDACGVTVEPWDRPHDHLCYATGLTRMLPALPNSSATPDNRQGAP